MAMGIFEQLSWLTTRVKKLCCAINAIRVGGLQSTNVDMNIYESTSGYNIIEGGIYQFINGTSLTTPLNYAYPTSVGQTVYIINTSIDRLTTTGLSPADRPYDGATTNPMPDIEPGEIWQLISVDGTAFGQPFIWRGFKVYPNAL
jgi:hypothetical protein